MPPQTGWLHLLVFTESQLNPLLALVDNIEPARDPQAHYDNGKEYSSRPAQRQSFAFTAT